MLPFQISDEAVRQMKALLERTPNVAPNSSIRLIISGLSVCSGPDWGLTLDEYSPEIDECCDFDGLRVIVERELLEAVGGLSVEYETDDDDPDAGGFLITPLDPEVADYFSAYGKLGGCSCCAGHCSGNCSACKGEAHES